MWSKVSKPLAETLAELNEAADNFISVVAKEAKPILDKLESVLERAWDGRNGKQP